MVPPTTRSATTPSRSATTSSTTAPSGRPPRRRGARRRSARRAQGARRRGALPVPGRQPRRRRDRRAARLAQRARHGAGRTSAASKIGIIGVANAGTATHHAGRQLRRPARPPPLRPGRIAAARDAPPPGAHVVVVVGARRRRVQEPSRHPDDLDVCAADSEIFRARARAAGRDGRRDRRRPHAQRDRPHGSRAIPIVESFANGRAFGRIDLTIESPRHRSRSIGTRLFPPQSICEARPLPRRPLRRRADRPGRRGRRRDRARPWPPRAPAATSRSASSPPPADPARPQGRVAARQPGRRSDARGPPRSRRRADQRRRAARRSAGRPAYATAQLFEAQPFDNRFATLPSPGASWRRSSPATSGRDSGIVSLSGVRAGPAAPARGCTVTLTRDDGQPVGPGDRLTLVTSELPGDRRRRALRPRRSPPGPSSTTAHPSATRWPTALRARKSPLRPRRARALRSGPSTPRLPRGPARSAAAHRSGRTQDRRYD